MISITTVEQLQAIADDMTADYVLDADIDLEGIDWLPLGTTKAQSTSSPTLFTGTLNGNGHAITNLHINRSTTDTYNFVGLFGRLGACTIQNLVIRNARVNVAGYNPCVGILAGHSYDADAVISNVSTQGDIEVIHRYTSREYAYRGVGGMVGSAHSYGNYYCRFTDCISNVNIKISGCDRKCYVSGFMGYGYQSVLTRCFAFGNITVTNTSDSYLSVSGMQAYCFYTTHTNCACAVNIIGATAETVSECCKYLTSTSSFTNNESRRYWQEMTIEWESYASDSDIALAEPEFVDLIGAEHIEKYNVDDMSFTEGKYIKLSIDTTGGYDITIGGVTYYGVKSVVYNGVDIPTLLVDGVTYEFGGGSESTDELAGTWVFNDVLTISNLFSYEVNLTSAGAPYVGIDATGSYLYYAISIGGGQQAYWFEENEWVNTSYKTITITSKLSEVTNGDTLLAWLQENATKQ